MKKIIIFSFIILIFILIILLSFNKNLNKKNPDNYKEKLLITPTLIILNSNKNDELINKAISMTPYETDDFIFDYSFENNSLILEEKTYYGKESFYQWLVQNNLGELANYPDLIIFKKNNFPTPTPVINNVFVDFLNILINNAFNSQSTPQKETILLESPMPKLENK